MANLFFRLFPPCSSRVNARKSLWDLELTDLPLDHELKNAPRESRTSLFSPLDPTRHSPNSSCRQSLEERLDGKEKSHRSQDGHGAIEGPSELAFLEYEGYRSKNQGELEEQGHHIKPISRLSQQSEFLLPFLCPNDLAQLTMISWTQFSLPTAAEPSRISVFSFLYRPMSDRVSPGGLESGLLFLVDGSRIDQGLTRSLWPRRGFA